MKTSQFICLGSLQHLRNRFSTGYAVQVKVAIDDVEKIKEDLISNLPGIEIQAQHNEMLFCNIPFSNDNNQMQLSFNLGHVFGILNSRKEQKLIESYSVTQTTLEQIFVQLAGEDEDAEVPPNQVPNTNQSK
ncbi:unnamed protein product [Adineta steineri]|uniref:ABCA1-4-like C-terminal R2 regulatory domain-containing protein n=1 Tax=Adineta steineri TaxID=433720 RepID=A0A813P8C0_9BILA|nr:unnamed protein product [Adineta steineri]